MKYSMEMYDKITCIAVDLLDGLVPESTLQLIAFFVDSWFQLMSKNQHKNDWPILQRDVDTLIQQAMEVIGPHFNTQNAHNLKELADSELVTWGLLCLLRAAAFESHHQLAKHAKNNTNGHNNEGQFIQYELLLEALRFVVHGGVWGEHHEYTAGVSLTLLRDPKKPHKPHPHIRKLTRYIGDLHSTMAVSGWNSPWIAYSLVYTDYPGSQGGKARVCTLPDEVERLIATQSVFHGCTPNPQSSIRFFEVHKIKNRESGMRVARGDAIVTVNEEILETSNWCG